MDRIIEKISKIYDPNNGKNIYGKHNEFISRLLGLWFNQSPTKRGLLMILNEIFILTYTVPIILYLIQAWDNDLDLFMENSVIALFCMSFLMSFILWYIVIPKAEVLFQESMNSWDLLIDKIEEDEVCKYLKLGHLYNLGFTGSLTLP
ncbi:hypothetical protein QAD02_011762 [Eretmocerus hayati]|uniref:Uncharacterized protein n=1 Tax=Eretmocerus hayati TaxID=131215 RepID=A0ACC2NYV6_9HYME|nr:hypothetical protein QAD02_011762 [Eretmocerus hayati]